MEYTFEKIEMVMDVFIIQLKALKKLYKNYIEKEKFKSEKENKIVENCKLITARKVYDFEIENGLNCSIEENEIERLISKTDILLKEDVWKKLYKILIIEKDEEEEEGIIITTNEEILLKEFIFNDDDDGILDDNKIIIQSTLINICIALESLASEILMNYYTYFGTADLKGSQLSFNDLLKIDDLESAKHYLIEKHIESTFYKDFYGWFGIINEKLNLSKDFEKELELILKDIREMFLRRNLLVHNNGIINNHYVNGLSEEKKEGIILGEKVDIDESYLEEKLNQVEKLGWMMYYSSMKMHIKNNDKDTIMELINSKVLSYIEDGCDLIPKIFLKCCNDSIDEKHKLYCKVNRFLYYKINNKINEEIIKEIKDFNVSHLSDEFKMAKAILLDSENCFEIVKEHFRKLDFRTFIFKIKWPLIRVIINKEEFSNFFVNELKKHLESKEDENEE